MKRKELYEYIREEIINELTEAAGTTIGFGSVNTNQDIAYSSANKSDAKKQVDKTTLSTDTKNAIKSKIDQNPGGNISIRKKPDAKKVVDSSKLPTDAKTTTKITIDRNPSGTVDIPLEESELEEMARKANLLQIQDPAKLALAKEIYTAGRINALLTALEAAGEGGMTQDQLGTALGLKSSSVLNSVINNLRTAGVLTPPTPKKEKIAKVEPEISPEIDTEVEDKIDDDEFYKDDEETTPEEKPEVASDKDVKKDFGKTNADLSPEEETLFNTYKTAITNKVKILKDKKASTVDKAKAQAAIDSYKINDNVKKVFTKKGFKLINYINSELDK